MNDAELTRHAEQVFAQLADWQLSAEEVVSLLGLPTDIKPRHLSSYFKGERALPNAPELQVRLEHPFSVPMRLMWLRRPHRRFQQRTPLAVILEEGVDGLQKVRMDVDCAYSYAIADAMAAAQQAKSSQ